MRGADANEQDVRLPDRRADIRQGTKASGGQVLLQEFVESRLVEGQKPTADLLHFACVAVCSGDSPSEFGQSRRGREPDVPQSQNAYSPLRVRHNQISLYPNSQMLEGRVRATACRPQCNK